MKPDGAHGWQVKIHNLTWHYFKILDLEMRIFALKAGESKIKI